MTFYTTLLLCKALFHLPPSVILVILSLSKAWWLTVKCWWQNCESDCNTQSTLLSGDLCNSGQTCGSDFALCYNWTNAAVTSTKNILCWLYQLSFSTLLNLASRCLLQLFSWRMTWTYYKGRDQYKVCSIIQIFGTGPGPATVRGLTRGNSRMSWSWTCPPTRSSPPCSGRRRGWIRTCFLNVLIQVLVWLLY